MNIDVEFYELKKGYRLGDKVEVVCTAASKEAKTIDFVLKKDYNGNQK